MRESGGYTANIGGYAHSIRVQRYPQWLDPNSGARRSLHFTVRSPLVSDPACSLWRSWSVRPTSPSEHLPKNGFSRNWKMQMKRPATLTSSGAPTGSQRWGKDNAAGGRQFVSHTARRS
jgi:hypothetical protein